MHLSLYYYLCNILFVIFINPFEWTVCNQNQAKYMDIITLQSIWKPVCIIQCTFYTSILLLTGKRSHASNIYHPRYVRKAYQLYRCMTCSHIREYKYRLPVRSATRLGQQTSKGFSNSWRWGKIEKPVRKDGIVSSIYYKDNKCFERRGVMQQILQEWNLDKHV